MAGFNKGFGMHRRGRLAGVMLLALMTSACGGGGGVNSTPTPPSPITQPDPPVAPTPTPPAPVVPPTVNYNDAEYARSNAAFAADALTAYNAGATGAGVKIAVLDSGLTDPSGQFTGRIDPASRDMVGNRGITDPDGHGTSVTAVAAAGRNGSDILGVAFNATVIALRTDDIGSCASSDGCAHDDSVLAQGVDLARQSGARVINMSLGGSPASSQLVAAIGRATAAGVIIVISAGNDATANPDPLAQVANTAQANGLVIIAGSHGTSTDTYAISDFSNRAGSFGQYYLTALGYRVRAFDQTGGAFLFSGTSYSAPAIAGAVALLAQAFPNLTGTQIVDLLMTTATDAGTAGTDSTYGRGILDLTRAFQPQGGTSLAGSEAKIALDSNATLGTAMGDAGSQGGASLGAVILDGYSRAYALNLAATIGSAAQTRPLRQAIGGDIRRASMGAGALAVSVTMERNMRGQPWAGLAQLGLTRDDSRQARALSGRAVARIDRRTAAAFGFAEGGQALSDMLADDAAAPFLIARGPADAPGFAARRGLAMAMRHDLGPVAVTVSAERGTVARYDIRNTIEPGYNMATARFDRGFGPLRLTAGLGLLREEGSVLGARFGPALGGGGATTRLVDLGGRWSLGQGWEAGAAWRQAWTSADRGGALTNGSLRSTAFAFDLGRTGRSDRFGLRVAQPLRVASGGYRLLLPSSYDYLNRSVGYETQTLNLAPKGRELDSEMAYGRRLGLGWIDTNFFWRRDPGNVAAARDDLGGAVRFSMNF